MSAQLISNQHRAYDDYLTTCSPPNNSFGIVVERYKSVPLCDLARLDADKLQSAKNYYRAAVDDLYERYYEEVAILISISVFRAISLLLVVMFLYKIIVWVRAGT